MSVLEKQRVVCLMPDPRRKVSAQEIGILLTKLDLMIRLNVNKSTLSFLRLYSVPSSGYGISNPI